MLYSQILIGWTDVFLLYKVNTSYHNYTDVILYFWWLIKVKVLDIFWKLDKYISLPQTSVFAKVF